MTSSLKIFGKMFYIKISEFYGILYLSFIFLMRDYWFRIQQVEISLSVNFTSSM